MLTKLRGEIYLFFGAFLFAFNGIISKIVLIDGLSAWRLTQIRTGGAFLILFAIYATFRQRELKPTRAELLRFVMKKHVPTSLWYAILLSFSGLLMITQIWDGLSLDRIGLIAAFLDALALAGYFLIGDRLGQTMSSAAIATWGFGVASALLLFVLPVWNFPTDVFSKDMELLGRFSDHTLPGWMLILWIVVMGTIAPYLFVVSGLKLLSASTASVFGMIEPVMAGMFAWWWLSESLNGIQLIGCVVVIVGIFIADKARAKAGGH